MPGPGAGGGPSGRGSNQNQGTSRERNRSQGGPAYQVAQHSGSGPSAKRAQLARQQFDRYMNTFAPVEDRLVDFTMSGAGLSEAVGNAREAVGTAFDTQREQTQRGLSRYGATRTPSEQEAAQRKSRLAEASARDNATNTARRRVEDRRLSLLAGGLDNANPRPEQD